MITPDIFHLSFAYVRVMNIVNQMPVSVRGGDIIKDDPGSRQYDQIRLVFPNKVVYGVCEHCVLRGCGGLHIDEP